MPVSMAALVIKETMVFVVDRSHLQRVMMDTVFIDDIDTVGFSSLVG